jgi:hypothetical protein
MHDLNSKMPTNVSESTTVTIVGVANGTPVDSRVPPTYGVTSYTVPSEKTAPSHPLSDGAVQVGNSVLDARVPESKILRDPSEDI